MAQINKVLRGKDGNVIRDTDIILVAEATTTPALATTTTDEKGNIV